MSRQQQRTTLKRIAQFAINKLAPDAPRHDRRLMARCYGNAAYRQLHDLSHILYGDTSHGYANPKYNLNRSLTNWVATEWSKYEQQQKQATTTPEGSAGSNVDVRPDDGAAEHSGPVAE